MLKINSEAIPEESWFSQAWGLLGAREIAPEGAACSACRNTVGTSGYNQV